VNKGAECPAYNVDAGVEGVGKSCLLRRFCDDGRDAPRAFTSTIGIDFKTRIIEIDSKRIRLHIVRIRQYCPLAKTLLINVN
jgi:GTPase SAR1 family protein